MHTCMHMYVYMLAIARVGPRRQTQQAHLQQLEDSLLQHPLGLYPHLEEAIPEQVHVTW